MTRKTQFANDQYYHIYNRGVDKRQIFLQHKHYYRFIHDLYEFNDLNVAIEVRLPIGSRTSIDHHGSLTPVGSRASISRKKRERLVEIVCFCLMPTHFHLILKQLIDKGISKFMHKLGTGYVNYFNGEQKRTGTLFEGRFKSILIENDEYLMHLSRYIHLNCIDLIEPKWKENGIKNWENAVEFLRNYKWSSYLDYIGRDNVPSVIDNEFLLGYFDNKKEYSQFVVNWMHDDIKYIKGLTLE